MTRPRLIGTATAIAVVAGVALFAAGVLRPQPDEFVSTAGAADTGTPVYYQDPDGKPLYSPTPKKTADGRDYRAVPAGADLSFDEPEQPAVMAAAEARGDRKVKYYRNPMGLPDTSPVPKKDSMGMDYIPVYEGDDSDDGTVRLSPGRIQRTGVRSEPAALRTIRTMVRAPGVIQLDERRVSVISMRSESFILKVANVTTGSHVVKGQPLMEVYSPAVASAAAEYLATITSKTTGGDQAYGRGSRQRLINLDVPEAAIAAIEKKPERADLRRVDCATRWHRPGA